MTPDISTVVSALRLLLGYSAVLTNPVIAELAAKYKSSPAQVVLAWHLARGVIVVPKSSDPQRQKDNLTVS